MSCSNPHNLECRMYESKYPEVDMAVMIQVKSIIDMGAYVSLLEYNNIEGLILFSDMGARRRIRSVSSLIKVGDQKPVMVLRVDEEKGYIDLSTRRLSEEDIATCEERYNKSKLVHSIMSHVAETLGLDLEDLYVRVGWPLYRKYGHALEAFKVIVTDPDTVLDCLTREVKEVGPDGQEVTKVVPALTEEVKDSLVKNIKEAMRKAEASGNDDCPVKIKLVAPPLTTQTLDKDLMGEKSQSVDSACAGEWKAEEKIAGGGKVLEALRELILYPFLYSHESKKLGLKWPKGLLLHGPPGTGKTSMVRAVVRECDAHLTMINPFHVHKAHVGESEKFLREAFAEAYSHASSGKPSVIFIDEIDAICPRRSNRREHESRIVGQLLTLMDGSKSSSKALPHIVVVASTNRVSAIDPALRRPGRFDSEIELTVPSTEERLEILELHSKNLHLDHDVDLQTIAESCNGYVGADLKALCREAARFAYRRLLENAEDEQVLIIRKEDWEYAKSEVGPSMTRGVAKEVAQVTWNDIGGLKDLKKKLEQAVEWPIKHADAFARLGISPVRGVLLHGPPGCSKTTLAKAAAHAAQASFFSLSGADLYSKYVGEGEALLRSTFQKARQAQPSIIFFDEADTIAPKRGQGGKSGGNLTIGERLLSTLLTEMDGLEQATGIIVLAATNRLHAIDPALRRPGRFDLVLHVPPPDEEGRYEILQIHTKKMKLAKDVDLQHIAKNTSLFTGADLEGLCTEAGMVAIREGRGRADSISHCHFQAALASLKPSLTCNIRN